MSLRILSKKAQNMRSEFGPSNDLDTLCDWTNDPDVMYAFESRAGAVWWRQHGGPPGLCNLLKGRHKTLPLPQVPTAKLQSPMCFACNKSLCATLQDTVRCVVVKCGCRSRVIHIGCTILFEEQECVLCEKQFSMCVRDGPLLTVYGHIRDSRDNNDK